MNNIAVVGCGKWGKNLIRVFSELKALYGIYDTDLGKKRSMPKFPFFNSFEAVLKTEQIKAVVIATPAITHYKLAKQVLLAGKDVFIEKPLAMNCKEGKELVDLAISRNKILMVGHLLMYHPAVEQLMKLVSEGGLGKINYIYSNRLNLGTFRTEENVLQSFAPHDISVILGLIGEEPTKVISHEGAFISTGISDTTITFMEFPCGAKAHIFVSWLHPFKEQKLVVVGTKAMAVFDDRSSDKVRIYPHKIKWEDGKIPVADKAGEYELIPELLKRLEPLKIECEHFLDCIKTRRKPITDGAQAMAVLGVLDRCHGPQKGSNGNSFVHESSFVDENVQIGEGTKIWHFSHILKGSKIGKNCNIGQNVVIGPNVIIGDNVKIQNNVSIYEGVTLEDDVFCGPSCVFTNVINPRSHVDRKQEFKKTLVRQGATIGANATIICGVTIEKYAFVGAGAVVTKNVPAKTVVYGVAASERRRIGKNG